MNPDVSNREVGLESEARSETPFEFDATLREDYFHRMSSTADKLEQEIKSLADVEKIRIVEAILANLDRPDPEIDRIWAEEARNC